jgi:acyl carrier protein
MLKELDMDGLKDSDVLRVVIEIYRSVLPAGTEVDADTDFFDAGGHSMTAARAVARIRQALRVRISLRDILISRTPGELSREVMAKL